MDLLSKGIDYPSFRHSLEVETVRDGGGLMLVCLPRWVGVVDGEALLSVSCGESPLVPGSWVSSAGTSVCDPFIFLARRVFGCSVGRRPVIDWSVFL